MNYSQADSSQLDLGFLLSWAALNRFWGGMPHVQNLPMMWHLKNVYKKKEKNDKTQADAIGWGPNDKDTWTRPNRSIISMDSSFLQLPSPWQAVLHSKQQECPQHCGLSLNQTPSCIMFFWAPYKCWHTCSSVLFLIFDYFLVHPWDRSLNISIPGSPPWPPRLSWMPLVHPRTWKALITLNCNPLFTCLYPLTAAGLRESRCQVCLAHVYIPNVE